MVWEQGGEAERRTRARAAAYDECVSVVVVAEWRDNKSGFGLRGSVIKHGVYEVVYSHRLSLARARKPGSAPTSLLSFIPEVIRNFFFLIYERCFCGRRNNMSPHYLEKKKNPITRIFANHGDLQRSITAPNNPFIGLVLY